MKRFTRISLRTLLILITVFAVWLAVQVNRAHRQREAVAWVEANVGMVQYDWQYDENDRLIVDAESPTPKWLRDLVGDEYFQDVIIAVLGNEVSDLTPLENLTKLKVLWLINTHITDAQVKQLQQALPNCEITRILLEGMTGEEGNWE